MLKLAGEAIMVGFLGISTGQNFGEGGQKSHHHIIIALSMSRENTEGGLR